MFTGEEIIQLLQNMIWLLAGVGIFIVGMNYMSEALEQSAGSGVQKLLNKIAGNRFSSVGVGAAVTAIIQSSSATSVMVIGLVNAGVMTLMQATPIIMGANIGTTITGILVAFKNDYFNMAMFFLAFVGVMMSFSKNEKVKTASYLCTGLGLIFVGLNIMSSEDAFGNALVKELFTGIFSVIDFPLLLILVGVIFTALLQSSSAATGVVITMVGTGVMQLDLALFIILGANIGTCVTALLASANANANSKRVALIHFTFNFIGTLLFSAIIWIFRQPVIDMLCSFFPENDATSLQMRVSAFHVIFNVSTTCVLLLFVKPLVNFSKLIIRDKAEKTVHHNLRFVDDHMLAMPSVALAQVKLEIDYMMQLAEESTTLSFNAMQTGSSEYDDKINEIEATIDFTNSALSNFLIKLSSAHLDNGSEAVIGSYFHVLNDLERIGDHAVNFMEISQEMRQKNLNYSEQATQEIRSMCDEVLAMFCISRQTFENLDRTLLPELTAHEDQVDDLKQALTAQHYTRLAEGNCSVTHSPYYTSTIAGLERIADHLVNVGYSILNPTGSQSAHL